MAKFNVGDLRETARPFYQIDEDGNVLGQTASPTQVSGTISSANVYLLDENNTPYGIPNIGGKPRVSSTPYFCDIAEGNVTNHYSLHKFGRNGAVGATDETVWSSGGLYQYLTGEEQLQVSSNDADDIDGGNGARTLRLYGLDGAYDELSEVITLNGTNNVQTVNSYLRVYRAIVLSAGASGYNEGTITISDNADVVTLAQIQPQENQTEMAIWTAPRIHTFYMTSLILTEDLAKATRVTMYVRPYGEVFQNKGCWLLVANPIVVPYEIPLKVEARSDIEFRALSAATGASVSAQFNGWYESD